MEFNRNNKNSKNIINNRNTLNSTHKGKILKCLICTMLITEFINGDFTTSMDRNNMDDRSNKGIKEDFNEHPFYPTEKPNSPKSQKKKSKYPEIKDSNKSDSGYSDSENSDEVERNWAEVKKNFQKQAKEQNTPQQQMPNEEENKKQDLICLIHPFQVPLQFNGISVFQVIKIIFLSDENAESLNKSKNFQKLQRLILDSLSLLSQVFKDGIDQKVEDLKNEKSDIKISDRERNLMYLCFARCIDENFSKKIGKQGYFEKIVEKTFDFYTPDHIVNQKEQNSNAEYYDKLTYVVKTSDYSNQYYTKHEHSSDYFSRKIIKLLPIDVRDYLAMKGLFIDYDDEEEEVEEPKNHNITEKSAIDYMRDTFFGDNNQKNQSQQLPNSKNNEKSAIDYMRDTFFGDNNQK